MFWKRRPPQPAETVETSPQVRSVEKMTRALRRYQYYPLLLTPVGLSMFFLPKPHPLWHKMIPPIALLAVPVLAWYVQRRARLRVEEEQELAKLEDTGCLWPLLRLRQRSWGSPRILAQIEAPILHLLGRLQKSDLANISFRDKEGLYTLFVHNSPPLCLAALQAIATLEDRDAIPVIREFLTQPKVLSQPVLVTAAQHSLERLEQLPTTTPPIGVRASLEELAPMVARLQVLRKQERWLYSLAALGLGGIISVPVLAVFLRSHSSPHTALSLSSQLFAFLMMGMGVVPLLLGLHKTSQREELATRLLDFHDVQCIGTILEHTGVAPGTNIVLLRLLPQLQASDKALLTLPQKKRLCTLLIRTSYLKDNTMVFAILKALEQIGGPEAIESVKMLLQITQEERVREAAEACLPFLEAQTHLQEQQATLLRAADQDASRAEVLLRPASATAPTEPQLLLRAAGGAEVVDAAPTIPSQ